MKLSITSRLQRSKMERYGDVSYLEVASTAHHMARKRLATMLLDLESNAAEQVA
jgi:hypothetical protein